MVHESTLVAATFEHTDDAETVVKELGRAGFGHGDISLMYTDRGHVTTQGILTGALYGGVIGGMVGLLFPPIGIVIAAGPVLGALASAITSAGLVAVAGGAVSGLAGALMQLGMPKDVADRFGGHVHKGDALVIVHTTETESDKARDIMDRHHPRLEDGTGVAVATAGAVAYTA